MIISNKSDRESDAEDGFHSEIIDIRHDNETQSLSQPIRTSLKGGLNGDDEHSFPSLPLWDQQGLRLFEKIIYCKEYYLMDW